MTEKLAEAVLIVLAVAVVARVVYGLLGPLLVPICLLVLVGAIAVRLLRRQ